MKYCSKCVTPESHETITFDGEGVCNICRQSEIKHAKINWKEREGYLFALAKKYKEKCAKLPYDCIVPFSGGKDSTFQLWYVVKKLELKPLVVRFNHWGYRPLVHENNIKTFKKLGVDIVEFTPNWKVVKKLMLESLKQTGDFCWHCHLGVFAHTMQVAVRYKIPLVIWGESSSEYRGYHTAEEMEEFDEKLFNEIVNLGIDANKMVEIMDGQVSKRDLMPFQFPSQKILDDMEMKAIYLGNYIEWNTKKQVEIIKQELDWQGQEVEGIPPEYDYEKIECRWQGIRDYCKYIKRGMGRTNHLASIDIRNGVLSREKGMELCKKYDGKRPASLEQFLRVVGITEKEFENILLANKAYDWGFDHEKLVDGKPLKDMHLWDNEV